MSAISRKLLGSPRNVILRSGATKNLNGIRFFAIAQNDKRVFFRLFTSLSKLLYIKKAAQTNLNSLQTSFTATYNLINNNYQPFYCISSMNSGRHMAEACSGMLQPSMCFSHTVLREYGDYRGCAKLKGVTSTPKPRFQKMEVATCLDLPLFIELIPFYCNLTKFEGHRT